MAIKDILLQLTSYPEPTAGAAIEQAVRFAQAAGARIAALACEIMIRVPVTVVASALGDLRGIIAAEHHKSSANARSLIDTFESAAKKHGVAYEHYIETCENSQVPDIVTEYARLSDVTMIPLSEQVTFQRSIAETALFGSGRPTIVFPLPPRGDVSGAFETIGVAWDFSRAAARAVADALPLLKLAKTVRVVTVTEEKPIETRGSGAELARHLALHGIEVISDTELAAGRPVGRVLEDYATARRLDLLVMGGYGHSRMREFILGGATKSILANPPLPVLLSH